jgi:serine/threonine-protein kinase
MEKRWIWPFELEDRIGEGAMGVVYRARFVKNDRRVALKLLPQELAANPTQAMRFQREMEVLKELRHPNIVYCFGGATEGKQQFYAMELVQGGTLASLLAEQGKIPWRQVIEYGLQVCAALAFSHAKGIIHRDLKPGNLLVTTSNQLKLSDFGLAMVAAEAKLTAAGKTMGSLHYMAPEQIRGAPPATHKVDLYALGCVLFEMLAGRTVFQATTQAELLQKHLVEAPPKVSQFVYDCPRQLEEVISELLFKDPEHRPGDAAAVAIRLKGILRNVVVRNPAEERQVALKGRGHAFPGERRRLDWRQFVMPGILLALVAFMWYRSAHPPEHVTQVAPPVTPLTDGLKHASPVVREFAATALGKQGASARAALPALIEALSDPVPEVRLQVALALGQIDSRDAAVWAKLRLIEKNDLVPDVRHAATQALQVVNKPQEAVESKTDYVPLIVLSVVALGWGIVQFSPSRPKKTRVPPVHDERILVSS